MPLNTRVRGRTQQTATCMRAGRCAATWGGVVVFLIGLHTGVPAGTTAAGAPRPSARETWQRRSGAAFDELAKYYSWDTGLFGSGKFWTSANALEAMIDHCRLAPNSTGKCTGYLANSWLRARGKRGFSSPYFDDAGWWGITWAKAAALTGDARYLGTAREVYAYMRSGWTPECGGGVLWALHAASRPPSIAVGFKAAVANQLFMMLGARLALASGGVEAAGYRADVVRTWAWLRASGVVERNSTVWDGMNPGCKLHPGMPLWSYNQIGGAVGASVLLQRLTTQEQALEAAHALARAGMRTMSDADGVVTERIDACNDDSAQFKGVYARYLGQLAVASRDPAYRAHLLFNAQTAWSRGRDPGGSAHVGCHWQGPYARVRNGNAVTQGSALDLFNAAAMVA